MARILARKDEELARIAHVVRRGDKYHFRLAVPRNLIDRLGKTEIKTSLKTHDLLTARQRGRFLSSAMEALFIEVVRMPTLTRKDVEQRIRSYFQQCLDISSELAEFLPQDKRSWDRDAELETLRLRVARLKRILVDREFPNSLQVEAREIISAGHTNLDVDLQTLSYACNLLLRAKIQDAQILRAELQGKIIRPNDPIFEDMMARSFPPLPGEEYEQHVHDASCVAKPHYYSASASSISYEDMVRRYKAQMEMKRVSPKTILETDRAFRIASECVEPTRGIDTVSVDDIRDVRDLITQLPVHLEKLSEFKGLSFKEAVELNQQLDLPKLSYKSQSKTLDFFLMPFRWALKEGYLKALPGGGITIPKPNAGVELTEQRQPFDAESLEKAFSSPLFTGCRGKSRRAEAGQYLIKDGMYWIPLIGFFTGMRLGEIVQLAAEDVRQENDIWFFDIRPGNIPKTGELKRVKNSSAIRQVPIVEDLLRLGFLKCLDRAEKGGRLFPEIPFGSDGQPSTNFSKFWGRYARKVGFKTDDLVFHSLRHTMVDTTRDAMMHIEASTRMMGHTLPGVRSDYGNGVSLKRLKLEMERLKPPIDVVELLERAQVGKTELPITNH